jgi:DnaJ-class molecular chaperone
MPDGNSIPTDKVVKTAHDAGDTLPETAAQDLTKTPRQFRRTYVECSCADCGGTGVIARSKSACFACNALGYVRVVVNLPVEED